MSLAHWLLRTAQAHPELPAVALGPRRPRDSQAVRSYAELCRAAAALAGWIKRSGARRHRPVAILSENRLEVVETLFACWWAGYAAAPIDPTLPLPDLAAALAYCDAELCIASPRAAPRAAEAARNLTGLLVYDTVQYRRALQSAPATTPLAGGAKDIAWLAFSDREPGQPPRAATLSHSALMQLALSHLAELTPVRPRDAQIHAAPWHGPSGFALLPTLARGGVNVMPESGAFDPAELFDNAASWRCASTVVSPHHLRAMIDCGADVAEHCFRQIIFTGGLATPRLIGDGLDRFGARLAQVYGVTAFPLGLSRLSAHDVAERASPHWLGRVQSVGRPFLSTEICVRDGSAKRCAEPGETGELFARGPIGMRGYWRDRRSRRPHGDGSWRATGVRARLDALGYLSVDGQIGDGPRASFQALSRVEEAMLARSDVADAAAVDIGRDESCVVVFICRDRSRSPDLLDPTAPPPGVCAVLETDAIPRSAAGRPWRETLRRRAEAALGPGDGARPEACRVA